MSFLKKLFKPKKQPITIVSGLPRSGTSMMMKMLEAGGIPPLTDKLREADTDNPKGYYEFERVKKIDKGDVAWLPDAEGKVVKIISALLKHLPSNYEYNIIFIHRHIDEVLASQRKMLVNRGEGADKMDDAQMADLFSKHLRATEQWIAAQPNINVLYIHYSDILSDPQPQAEKVTAFLGGKLNVEAMTAVVDPSLYRNKA